MDMKTNLLIIGKGDNVITMILDNLASVNKSGEIHIYNNLSLDVMNKISHPKFDIKLFSEINIDNYEKYCLGVYQPNLKKILVEKFGIEKNKLVNIIHQGLVASETVKLGEGLLINSLVTIAAHTIVGDYASINRNVSIGHHTVIGDYSSINPGVNIAGNVKVGVGTTIGMGVNIINGVTIGDNTIIGAGSLVTKDIPSGVVAYGNPCKVIRNNTW
jgi:sugar O-acyltransferase (sialic acid O-acetyltransferase NeuD family)